MVLPVPTARTRGIQVVPTTNGSALLGPDAADTTDRTDTQTEAAALAEVFAQAGRLVPAINLDIAIKSYAANRPASAEPVRLRYDRQVGNLLHVGNRSTGVSTAPAYGPRVLALLRERGLNVAERPDAVDTLPRIRRLLLDDAPESLVRDDPRYAQVVCVCEQVTAAEIGTALSCAVPAASVEGVRKRTRATAGRCQGSVCMAGVILMCSVHTNTPPAQVRMGRTLGTVGVDSEG
jgi:glycerol-3-phosphate dehydrogenase